MATGSYEESLPAEGTPVITKRLLSRDGVDGDLGGFDILRPVPTLRRAGRTVSLQRSWRRARREDESSESRHGCQRLGRISAVGRRRPRRHSKPRGEERRDTAPKDDSPKRSRTSWNVRSPGKAARSLILRGRPPSRKWRWGSGNTRGAGTRSSIGWQTSVGRIACLLRWEVARSVDARGR